MNNKHWKRVGAILFFSIMFSFSAHAGRATGSTITSGLAVAMIYPVSAVVTTQLEVTFTEAVDVRTVTARSFNLTGPLGPVAGIVNMIGQSGAVFTPTIPLAFNTDYTASLTSAIKGTTGKALTEYQWHFNTGRHMTLGGFNLKSDSVTCARSPSGGRTYVCALRHSGRGHTRTMPTYVKASNT